MTIAEVENPPAVIPLLTAARALGISRNSAYRLVKRGEFPVGSSGSETRIGCPPSITRTGFLVRVASVRDCGSFADGDHWTMSRCISGGHVRGLGRQA
ncbi:helix-turn-helix domain-containing protein [Spongiactinospora rosea]|uniref:helix-turn-helix domain-containing protein n=1 Tax=Spongiactinospora rosea TaxID=2248750 RepID=UPI00385118C8